MLSADWVALDMESMLRECDGSIAAKDDQLRRLEESVKALQSEIARATEERRQAVAAREKAEHVLLKLRAAIDEAAGLRASQGQGPSRLRIVPPPLVPAPDNDALADLDREPTATAADPIRIDGSRSIAVMRIIGGDPCRAWRNTEVARLLEGEAKGADRRTRFLLESLHKQAVVEKIYSPDGKRTFYRLAAAWEAA
ncbi:MULTISPECIES: hypothetical protein [unclassified Streptomyces]|uniref:hypothetical protein n=1 Tax=unclassified Streptomyces TaxID=2593676 RepID=UPI002E1F8A4B|nr:hypothetical protein OG217_22705 [Streptomyces sp. NBC_01023]